MTEPGERWKHLEELYHAALALAPERRKPFLQEACPDSTLRREVESLLGAKSQGDRILDGTAAASPVEPGTVWGANRIEEQIGAGGMGEVYRARDTRLKRDVALKVLPAHVSRDPERRVRFLREAQAAARLNHPNIVTLRG
jgi:serine/threonine protein kinase